MSCEDDQCGISGSGVNPGDPDNNSVLSATPAYGGIDINWSMPTLNPFAVSHTKVFRSLSSDFFSAAPLIVSAGNFYFDRVGPGVRYYYWIQIVSINGTHGAEIGPASAIAMDTIEKTIQDLTGRIDRGVLAQSLKTDIDKITLNYDELVGEIAERIAGNAALSAALAAVQSGAAQSLALLNTEITTRMNGQDALAQQIVTIAAVNANNAAAILEEKSARVTADSAMATTVGEVLVASQDASAGVRDINTSKIGYSALATGAGTPDDGDNATIIYPDSVYPASIFPEYSVNRKRIIDKEGVTNWNDLPVSTGKKLVWITGFPMASAVKQVGVTDADGNEASLEQAMTTQKDLNGNFKGLYTAKVSVTNSGETIIGGFGIYGDTAGVEAGFDVDRFWVGRTDLAQKTKPFIIDNGVVYINDAAINKLTFSKLRDESGSIMTELNPITGKSIFKADYIKVGKLVSGPYTSYNWPAAGTGNGFYLGPGGLLLGNYPSYAASGKTIGGYFQVEENGDIYSPSFDVYNGKMTLKQLDVVGTLNIAGNAVTVPLVQNFPGTTEGNNSDIIFTATTISLDVPGMVFASCTGYISYGTGYKTVYTTLKINGVEVSKGGGTEGWVNAAHSGGLNCPAGPVTVTLTFNGQPGSRIINPSIFVMGAKR